MAISVQPVDGLINRLLQQNSSSAAVSKRRATHPARQDHDQISISTRAQAQHQTNKQSGQEKALESHLLNLYKMNDAYGA